MQLKPATDQLYSSTFGYEFQNDLILFPDTLIANSGNSQSQFLIAVPPTVAPGYYIYEMYLIL